MSRTKNDPEGRDSYLSVVSADPDLRDFGRSFESMPLVTRLRDRNGAYTRCPICQATNRLQFGAAVRVRCGRPTCGAVFRAAGLERPRPPFERGAPRTVPDQDA
jgi:hypothetical protein